MRRVIIIAEAGVNHNGDIEIAKKLIVEAKNAGADYVKFQTFKTELNINKNASKAKYQINNTGDSESQYEMVKKFELSFIDFEELNNYCEQIGIKFLSTGFDYPSIDFLYNLKPPFFKIPSGEIINKSYLEYIAKKGIPIIISTGMANLEEVNEALKILINGGITKNNIIVLHCNTEYPTPMEDVNLRAMNHIEKELGVKVGYSDHTLGIEVPIAAVAMGATVIEKHFTLDRTLPGPDHAASLEPKELKAMVQAIRNIEKAINGSGIKEPSESEKKNILIARKSLHVNKDLIKGHIIRENDLIALRPGYGISPMEINQVIGKPLICTINANEKLTWEHLKK